MANNVKLTKHTADAVLATSNVRFALTNSVIANALNGVRTAGANSIVNVDDVFTSFCTTGFSGGGGSTINVSDSIIAQNGTGVSGTVHSFQGNSFVSNGVNGTFTTITLKT